jgi:hypothetical protein
MSSGRTVPRAGDGPVRVLAILAVVAGFAALPAIASAAIREFRTPTASSRPITITASPDRPLWFSEFTGNASDLRRATAPLT